MGSDTFNKRAPLDHIMNLYNDEIGVDVMSMDLVFVSITHLIKHYENGETAFKDIDQDLTAVSMKAKL
jgi:hypothetical protein